MRILRSIKYLPIYLQILCVERLYNLILFEIAHEHELYREIIRSEETCTAREAIQWRV